MSDAKKQANNRIILIAFIIVLALLNMFLIYFLVENNKKELALKDQVIDKQKQEQMQMKIKLDSISAQLAKQIERAKSLQIDFDSLSAEKEKVDNYIKQLQTNQQLSQNQIKEYQEKIKAYEELLIRKDKEMERLKQIADELYEQNTKLKNEKNELIGAVTEYKQRQEKVEEKLADASVLKAENLTINAVNSRGKIKGGGVYKNKDIDRLEIIFTLADNKLAKIGTKDLMMRLIEPDGLILYNPSAGGGQFPVNGQAMYYTQRQQILFDNSQQTVKFVYNKDKDFKIGRYSVEIYSEGKKIGTGSFEVR
ncbi:MAG: chromosome segregation protein SMC [Microscillaceae bacterium]|nr:chromosome segregation protein SMC [Microscillaceae bacterium]MDW8459595.1 chromosome segregation protein SMC [Cytophagales bacterium]